MLVLAIDMVFADEPMTDASQEHAKMQPPRECDYTDPDAARVLATLEQEMMEGDGPKVQLQHLRCLLEAECKAQVGKRISHAF